MRSLRTTGIFAQLILINCSVSSVITRLSSIVEGISISLPSTICRNVFLNILPERVLGNRSTINKFFKEAIAPILLRNTPIHCHLTIG